MSENLGNTQPNITVRKPWRGRAFLFSALGLIIILVLAILAGYSSGISIRKSNETSNISQQLGVQFQYALVDIEFGRYENAKERLDFILTHDPSFPGVQEKLTQVLVLMNRPTPTITASLTSTPDFTGAEQAFTQAQQLIAAQDWPGALGTLDQIRKLDRTYKTGQVDGMYYFALRNYGYDLITKQGNLEGGIYHFTLAERFGTLDRDANGLRQGARFYLIGASFWELDWQQALAYFTQVAGYGLWDGTMTVSERLHFAYMRYGDQLVEQAQYCDAVTNYDNAQAIAALDATAQEGYNRAFHECFPPTPTIDLTLSVTPQVTVETPAGTTEPPPTAGATTQAPPTVEATTAVPPTVEATTAVPTETLGTSAAPQQ
jgi:tetratricopeptide (TPR) repeat protein